MKLPLPVTCTIASVPLHYVPVQSRTELILSMLAQDKLSVIFTPNPEILLKSMELPWYKDILTQADWNMPDGVGLQWASTFLTKTKTATSTLKVVFQFVRTYMAQVVAKKTLRHVIPEVITGQDSFFAFHEVFNTKGTKVFYFGGENGVDAAVAVKMASVYPHLQVVGHTDGYPFRSPDEWERINAKIKAAQPEVLFVALSFPRQEQWVIENKAFLESIGVKIVMIVGGTYDVAVGKIKRAPKLFKQLGIEFLWRLAIEPKRWMRIMRAVFLFPYALLLLKIKEIQTTKK